MNRRLADLYTQQGRLLERISVQRAHLQQQLAPMQRTAQRADAMLAMWHQSVQILKEHPLTLVVVASGLILLYPRRAWTWAGRGLLVWRTWRGLRRWLPLHLIGR